MKGEMTKYGYKTVDVDVEVTIDVDDIIEFIDYHATDGDLIQIKNTLQIFVDDTINGDMKRRVLEAALNKYSLEELENRLEIDYTDHMI